MERRLDAARRIEIARDAPVDQRRLAALAEQDVVRRDVAVHDAVLVRVRERLGDRDEVRQQLEPLVRARLAVALFLRRRARRAGRAARRRRPSRARRTASRPIALPSSNSVTIDGCCSFASTRASAVTRRWNISDMPAGRFSSSRGALRITVRPSRRSSPAKICAMPPRAIGSAGHLNAVSLTRPFGRSSGIGGSSPSAATTERHIEQCAMCSLTRRRSFRSWAMVGCGPLIPAASVGLHAAEHNAPRLGCRLGSFTALRR